MAEPPLISVAARLDRLPNTRSMRRLVALLSLGGCFEFYDLFFAGYIAPALYASKIFTPTTRGFLGIEGFASFVASLFAGLFVGSLFFSRICDRMGRRAIFSYSLLWYSACTCVMAFRSTAGAINLWRFVAGIGIGVELVTIDTYLSELVPKDVRGRAFAFQQFVCFLAVPLAALLSWFFVPRHVWGLDGWRWVALIGASGALFVWYFRRSLPESPRWLEQQGRQQEADRVMLEIEDRVRAETGMDLPPPILSAIEAETSQGEWREIWNPVYGKRTIMLIVFHLFETLGYYGFANWAPTFLLSKGVTVTQSLSYTFVMALASPFGPLVGQFVADKFERKWQVVGAALLMAVFGLFFSGQSAALGVISLGILMTLSSNWFSFAYHAYQAELYPTRIRARAIGFVYSWSRFGVIVSSFLIAWALRDYGTVGVFSMIAGAMTISAAAIAGWGPLTNRRALEDISR